MSSKESVLQALLDSIEAVKKLAVEAYNAKSPDRMKDALARLSVETGKLERQEIALKDYMSQTAKEAFKSAGGSGAMDPKILARIKKAQELHSASLSRAATDIRTWGADFGRNIGYNKDIQTYKRALEDLKASDAGLQKIERLKKELDGVQASRDQIGKQLAIEKKKQLRSGKAGPSRLEANYHVLSVRERTIKAQITRERNANKNTPKVQAVEAKIKELEQKKKDIPPDPMVRYRRGKATKGFKGNRADYYMPAETHMKMLMNTSEALSRNYGVAAAAKGKSGWVIVSDGLDCGWVTHRGSGKANGMVVEWIDAMNHPISHPNCQRTFTVANGPPGSKKLLDQRRAMGLTKKTKLQKAAEVAAAAGIAGTAATAVATNPFVKRVIRDILADADFVLGPLAQRFLTRLTSYEGKEASAFKDFGKQLGTNSQAEFNKKILATFDDNLANEAFLMKSRSETVQITAAQARTLGVPFRLPKGQLLDALDDYGDWVIHRDALNLDLADLLEDHAMYQGVNEQLWHQSTAAMRYQLQPPAGVKIHGNWFRTLQQIKATYASNPDKADRDLIRLIASMVDPTPWLKKDLGGGFKFSMGMTSRGRQDLSVKIFERVKKSKMLTEAEARWAEMLGMDLSKLTTPNTIRMKDIVDAFTPRVSYQSGGLFSSTIGLQNGKIQALVRLYPDGALTKYMHLEGRLRTGVIEDFIKTLRSGDGTPMELLKRALGDLHSDDFITTVGLFRRSPLEVSLRFAGLTPESWAIKALPENDLLRYSYRFWFDKDTITEVAWAKATHRPEGMTLGEALDRMSPREVHAYRAEAARRNIEKSLAEGLSMDDALLNLSKVEYEAYEKALKESWRDGITILPKFGKGFGLDGFNMQQMEVLLRLKSAGHSLLVISKRTRYGYDSLLEWYAETKNQIQEMINSVNASDLRNVRSFDDLLRVLKVSWGPNRIDTANRVAATVDMSFADAAALVNPSLAQDLRRFSLAWRSEFPDLPVPKVHISHTITHPFESTPGNIWIRSDVALDWDTAVATRRKLVYNGFYPRNSEDIVATLVHEAAHAYMSDVDMYKMIRTALDSYQTWPNMPQTDVVKVMLDQENRVNIRFINNWLKNPANKAAMARRMSGHGAEYGWDEILADAFSEYFGSPNPRKMSVDIVEEFRRQMAARGTVAYSKFSEKTWAWSKYGTKAAAQERYDEINDLFMDQILQRTAFLQANKHEADIAAHYTPQWVTFAKGSKYEGLYMDKKLREIPDLEATIKEAFLDFKARFPDLKFPKVQYQPFALDNPGSTAAASYDFSTKIIKIPQLTFDNWKLAEEQNAAASVIGFHPKGTEDIKHLLLHEAGHHVTNVISHQDLHRIAEQFQRSMLDLSYGKTSAETRGFLEELGTILNDDDVWTMGIPEIASSPYPNHTLQRLVDIVLFENDGVGPDKPWVGSFQLWEMLADNVSDYGSTSFFELLAEMISASMEYEPRQFGSFLERIAWLLREIGLGR